MFEKDFTAAEDFLKGGKTALHQFRNSGKDKNVVILELRRTHGRQLHQFCPGRDERHPTVCRIQPFSIISLEHLQHLRRLLGFSSKPVGNSLDGHIVMGWANTTGGENPGIIPGILMDMPPDDLNFIRKGDHPLHLHPEKTQFLAKVGRV